ncbi:MAG: hypothetical protein KJO07_10830 [Deltaproteobacteria bacterium]|nr:hypothetical protein [Deltaproteobacteria bacterium]
MSKAVCISGALALALVTGCGGKDKKKGTTPATAGTGGAQTQPQNPEDIDPNVSGDVPTSTFGDGGGAAGGGGGGGGAAGGGAGGQTAGGGSTGGGATSTPAPPPPIKPPGLDLTAAQKAQKIKGNLRKAGTAMAKNPPDAETGIAESKAALAVDETNLTAMLYLAHGNYAKGYYDIAEYVLVQAEKTKGGQRSPKLYLLQGLVFQATEREDKAERAFGKAVSLNGNYRSALINLGVYHIKNKRYGKARTVYEKLTGPLGSKSAAAWTNLGSAYRGLTGQSGLDDQSKRKLLLRAESSFKKALTLRKRYANAYYNLGLLYLDADPFPVGSKDMDTLKRLDRAKTYFEEYSRQPGADKKLAKEQMAVAQKLYDREKRIRDKRRKREEKRRKRDAARKKNG